MIIMVIVLPVILIISNNYILTPDEYVDLHFDYNQSRNYSCHNNEVTEFKLGESKGNFCDYLTLTETCAMANSCTG